jgi:hypothetical protein
MGTQSVPHPEIASAAIPPSAVADTVLHQAKAGECCSPEGDDLSDDITSAIALKGFLATAENDFERGAIDAITKRRREKGIVIMVEIIHKSQCFEIMIDTYLSVS